MSDADARLNAFFAALEATLGGPNEQRASVLAEVRADVEAQVVEAMARGTDRELAWTQALDSVGEPVALARSMRGALTPAPPAPWIRNLRIILSGLVAGSGVLALFVWRSTDYGFDPRTASVIVGLHLPLALLLWPGLIWRWNPLFSTGAAALAVLLALGLNLGAQSSTTTITLGPEGAVATPSVTDAAVPFLPPVFAGLALLTITLLQRSSQRRVVLAGALGLLAAVEAVHQVEEALFRSETRHAEEWIDSRTAERGSLPTSEEFAAEYEPRWLSRLHYDASPGQDPDGAPSFAVFWSRATQNHHELIFHSDGTITGND